MLVYLRLLQPWHAFARLLMRLVPPLAIGMMCSIEKHLANRVRVIDNIRNSVLHGI